MKNLLNIFWLFLKISATTHGGGYAMVGIMERELVENKKVLSDDDFVEIIGVCQTLPGPLALTSSSFIGYRLIGFSGAIFALLGILIPSFVMIFIIATLLLTFDQNPYVIAAIEGVDSFVPMLILLAVIKFFKNVEKTKQNLILILISIIALEIFNINPILLIVAYSAYGIIIFGLLSREEKDDSTN